MARPRLHKNPSKLNLTVSLESKRTLFKLASAKGVSISQMVVMLANDAALRIKAA